jgi:ABC-2 type transport system ATP-binding protein
MTSAAPLALVDVAKALAGTPVLREVSFACPAGEITALLGPNGAGKTTAVAVATGLRAPDSGDVRVFGKPVRDRAARSRFSVVPQDISLPAAVTVRHLMDFVAGQRPPSPLAPARAQICERLAISTLLDRRAGGLSGGQQRKVAVALGLLRVPGLLIMDEATTNLDEATRARTWQLVCEYAERGGAALVTSHILADIDSHADRVVALNLGQVVLESRLTQVRARLGGSSVSISLASSRRGAVIERVSARLPGAALVPRAGCAGVGAAANGAPTTVLEWRTREPLPLVAALAELAPDATELLVRPIPLGDVLREFAEVGAR